MSERVGERAGTYELSLRSGRLSAFFLHPLVPSEKPKSVRARFRKQARHACPPPWRPLSAGLTSRSVARAMIEQPISGSSVPVAILLHAYCFRVAKMGLIARTAEWLDHCALRGERSQAAVARKRCLSRRTHEHVRGHRMYDFCANISIRQCFAR
jgi:hypothetical protein